MTTTESHSGGDRIFPPAKITNLRTESLRKRQFRLIKVYSKNATSMSAKQLNREQTYQANTCDNKSLSKSRPSQSNTLKTNTCDNRKSSFFIRYVVGNESTKILRYTHYISMGSIRNNPASSFKPGNIFSHITHHPDIAITKRQWLC